MNSQYFCCQSRYRMITVPVPVYDGSFLADEDCWEVWWSILACSLVAVHPLPHFGQTKVWDEDGRDAARSVCLLRFSCVALYLSASNSQLAFFTHHHHHHHHHHHQSFNREGRWGTTDDFATSFLHFPLFSTALWDLPNSRPIHSLMLSSHLFLCPPCLLPPFTVPCKMVLARPDERETWLYHCSLRHFTIVRRSSCGPIACWILARTSSSTMLPTRKSEEEVW